MSTIQEQVAFLNLKLELVIRHCSDLNLALKEKLIEIKRCKNCRRFFFAIGRQAYCLDHLQEDKSTRKAEENVRTP